MDVECVDDVEFVVGEGSVVDEDVGEENAVDVGSGFGEKYNSDTVCRFGVRYGDVGCDFDAE